MTSTKKVSGESVVKSREEMLDECLDLGIPVTGNEDIETLELYLASSDEDDDDIEDEDDDEFEEDDFEDEDAVDEEEIFEEDLDIDEDEDDDLFDDDEAPYN
jgi:hypothetical protein